jgi:hypothetical protein
MDQKQIAPWIVFLLGLLMLVLVIGSLLQAARPPKGTPTPWQVYELFTVTPGPATGTPGWWAEEATPPAWPTQLNETTKPDEP